MALSNFTNISAKVQEWLNRQGADPVTTNVEDFIILAQRRITRDVRIPPMEVLTTLVLTANRAPIPSAMLDVKEMIAYDGENAWDVYRSTFSKVRSKRLQLHLKGPDVFDTVADNFEFGPALSSGVAVDLVYYQELDFISTSVATNWFSLFAPELILYGALVEASVFLKDFEQEQKYERKYTQGLDLLTGMRNKAEWAGRLQVNR